MIDKLTSPDFDKYDLESLMSSLAGIDREKYPENYRKLICAIEKRKRERPIEVVQRSIPEGFKSTLQSDGSILIEFTERHRVGISTFILLWLIGWTWGGIGALSRVGESWFVVFWSIGWAISEVAVTAYLLWLQFGKCSFALKDDEMVFRKQIFKWGKSQSIQKSRIKRIFQIQDIKEDSETQPKWGLKIQLPREVYLLKGQEYENSEWLGGILEKWSGMKFEKVNVQKGKI